MSLVVIDPRCGAYGYHGWVSEDDPDACRLNVRRPCYGCRARPMRQSEHSD